MVNKSSPFGSIWPNYRDRYLIPLIEEEKIKDDPVVWAPVLAHLKKERDENPEPPF